MDVAAGNPYQKVVQAHQNEQLILDHLGYVRHVMGRTIGELPEGVDRENLEAAGILGLVEAASQFDPSRDVKFTTFAYLRIRGAILDELRRNCPLTRKMLKCWESIRDAYARLSAPVSPEDLAAATELSVEEVLECLQSIRLTNPDTWHDDLDRYAAAGGEEVAPEAALEEGEEWEILVDSIEQLPTQERNVLSLYYMEDLRLKEIGEVLALSESRVSRVLTSAELRLKETVRRRADGGHQSYGKKVHTHGKHATERDDFAGQPHSASPLGQGPHRAGQDRRVVS